MKELFLDSANTEDISLAVRTDAVAGITTNPSLMAKEASSDASSPWEKYTESLVEISRTIEYNAVSKKHLSVEVITLEPKFMLDQAHRLYDLLAHRNKIQLFVKIPIMFETLDIISNLTNRGIKVNATAAMTALQAKMAHDAGAPVVSFFYNRMKDECEVRDKNRIHIDEAKSLEALSEISNFSNELNRHSQIICGSIRRPQDIEDCWRNGADIVTASLPIIKGALKHPQTDKAVAKFQEDIEAWLK